MNNTIQHQFFERVKQKLDPHLSLVNEVAEVLQISNDSVYRRLRGETALSLDEAITLGHHFKIDLEEVLSSQSESVLFGRSTFRDRPADFDIYLEKTENYLAPFTKVKEKQGYYAAKDIPIFYFFQFPELAQFKLFFWLKTMRDNTAIGDVKFDLNIVPEDLMKRATRIAKLYFSIPFIELWNEDTINTALRQIHYFSEAGWMARKEVTNILLDKMTELFQGIQQQAATGLKWWKSQPVKPDVPWELYFNELTVLDNSMLLLSEDMRSALIGYNSLDYLYTSHAGFCGENKNYFHRQIAKSLKISGAAEKERNQFFNRMYERIHQTKNSLQ